MLPTLRMLRAWRFIIVASVAAIVAAATTTGTLFLVQISGEHSDSIGDFAGVFSDASVDSLLLFRILVSLGGLATVITVLLLQNLLAPKVGSDAFGSAAFAAPEDIADLSLAGSRPILPGSVLLGSLRNQRVILPPEQARRHGIIVGGSGSGKSFSFFLPNAARLRGTSCVFSDPKSELFRFTSGFHTSLRFAPCEPDASEPFNWIPLCRSPDQKTLLSQLSKSKSAVAREQANIFTQASERMRGSIVPAIAARLQFMRDPAIARFTSASLLAPRFAALRKTPMALFYCLPEKDIPRLRPLTSLFFTLLLEELNAEGEIIAGGADSAGTAGTVPVLLFLDEFGVTGSLPSFEVTIALARGRGLGFWLGVQSLSQLESVYGRAAAQTILTNCSTKIALSGLDVETAEYFSRSLGQGTIARKMRSWQRRRFSLFASTMGDALQEQGRPLLSADEVRRLPEEEMLVITGNRRPLMLKKIRYAGTSFTAKARILGIPRAQSFDTDVQSGQNHTQTSCGITASVLPPLPDDL